MRFPTLLTAAGLWFAANSVGLAHPQYGISNADGFAAGLAHPCLGLDHVLAMVAVGILAVQMGGRAIWMLPSSFLGMMIVGGIVGMQGWELMLTEPGIAVSVVMLGAALAVQRKYQLATVAVIVAVFGGLHGHAHGLEAPHMTAPMLYMVGFVVSTVLLHTAGIVTGLAVARREGWTVVIRFSGAAMACVGVLLLFGVI